MTTIMSIASVNVGPVAYLGERRGQPVYSGIRKRPIMGAGLVELTPLGLRGDEQADQRTTREGRRIHGGALKAVYVYPVRHLVKWDLEYRLPVTPGSFGENLTVAGGPTEDEVYIGDQWSWGDALLEVTGPRRPCYKLDMLWGAGTAAAMMRTGRTGWYCRVLQHARVPILGQLRLVRKVPGTKSVRDTFLQKIARDPTIPDLPEGS